MSLVQNYANKCILTDKYSADTFDQSWTQCPAGTELGIQIMVAEELCPRSLKRQLEVLGRDTVDAIYKGAWSATERGLSLGAPDSVEAQELFTIARRRLDTILDSDGSYRTGPVTLLGASALRAFMHAFIERSHPGDTFRKEGCKDIYESLVFTLGSLSARDRKNNSGHVAEVEIMALLARTKDPVRLAYPASPREEARADNRKLNHDVYVFRKDQFASLQKLPIQIKMRKKKPGLDGIVKMLYYKDDVLLPIGFMGNSLVEAMCRDISGEATDEDEILLVAASTQLVSFIDEHLTQ